MSGWERRSSSWCRSRGQAWRSRRPVGWRLDRADHPKQSSPPQLGLRQRADVATGGAARGRLEVEPEFPGDLRDLLRPEHQAVEERCRPSRRLLAVREPVAGIDPVDTAKPVGDGDRFVDDGRRGRVVEQQTERDGVLASVHVAEGDRGDGGRGSRGRCAPSKQQWHERDGDHQ